MSISIAVAFVDSIFTPALAAGLPSTAAFAEQAFPVLLDAVIKATLILVVAWAATALMAKASAAARHLVWALAVAASLVLPLLATLLPAWRVLPDWAGSHSLPISDIQPTSAVAFAPVSGPPARSDLPPPPLPLDEPRLAVDATPAEVPMHRQASGPERSAETAAPPPAIGAAPERMIPTVSRSPLSLRMCLWIGWCIGSAFVFTPVLLAAFALWRIGRSARCWPEAAWGKLLSRLCNDLNLQRRVRLLRGDRRPMPMTWGIVRPQVLLPSAAQEWPEAQRRIVLLHELAHVVRWDCLWQLIAHLAVAIYWFNPLVWLAARRMRVERERACDDIVLRAGTPGTEYADRLLTVASGTDCGILSRYGAIAMARPSGLEGRVRAILDTRQSRQPMTMRGWALALILCTAAALPLAMLRAADSAPLPPPPPTAAIPDGHSPPAATAPAWPAELPAWIELDDLGDNVGMPKQTIALRPEQFLELLDLPQAVNRRPRLSKDWKKKLGQPILNDEANWLVPNDLRPPADDAPTLSIRRLSADRAIVMILKPRGSFLWHHYYECLATFDVARGRELDAWLGLDVLQATYTVVHRGIGHGATSAAARKVLGEPDAVVHYQAVGFYNAYYFEGDIGLQFQNGIVRRVSRGVPRSVKAAVAKKGKALGPEDVREDEPAAPAGTLLSKTRDAIAAVQARCKDDAALKPLADGTAREVGGAGGDPYDLSVETPDRWDGFPSKVGPPTRGSGSIMIRVHKIVRPSDRAWTPFVAPPGCWVGRNWLDGPDGSSVLVYSQLGDRAAHRRLISVVAQEFGKVGIGLNAAVGEDMESHGQAKEPGEPLPAKTPATRPAAETRDRPNAKITDVKNVDAQTGWGEAVNGLQLRLTLPAGAEYARGTDPVLRIELRNVARPPVRFAQLPVRIDAELTAADGSRIAGGAIEAITPWEGRDGAVVGGASLTWDVPFSDFRHRDPLAAGSAVRVRVRFAVRGPGSDRAGTLTEVFSGIATVAIRDAHPQPLAEADVPAGWEKSLSVSYTISGGFRATSKFRVDGEGRATIIAAEGLLGDRGVGAGRYEAILGPGDLDRLVKTLREARVWELSRIPEDVPAPDEGVTFVSIANGGASLARSFPQRTVADVAAMKPLQAEITRLMLVVVSAAKAEREMWEKSAVASMRAFLAQRGGELAREVGPFVDNPTRGMRVADGPDNAYVIARLRDNDPDKARYADIDPREVVVVSVFGPAGGAFELGVVLDRKTGRERAVALVPGK